MALKRIWLALGGSPHMTEQKRLRVMRETQIMETMKHPHIVQMHAHFIDSEVTETFNEETEDVKKQEKWYLCIVMEHASKGDLLHLIEKHKESKEPIDERLIWTVCS
jgi:serine/threonine protein kinase